MSFMQQVITKTKDIWDECVKTPFVQEVKNGTLPLDKFKQYMIQDSIYLKHYARIFGKAIYHATTLKEIQTYYSALSFVTDTESAVRLRYLDRFGITDNDIEFIKPLAENQNYIDFMVEIAEQGEVCEILMAVLPCMLSYGYIFKQIAAEEAARDSKYWDFISDYATDHFDEVCKQWCSYADEICSNLPQSKQEKLNAIFERSSLLELDFWKMAYQVTKD